MDITAPPRPTATTASYPLRRSRRPLPARGVRTLISDLELSRGRTRVWYGVALTLVTVGFALVFLFPVYWMVSSAVKSPAEFALTPPTFVPRTFEPETYARAWTEMRIARYFANTVGYALGGWLIQLVVDVAVAYALSKLRPVLGRLVLGMMLTSLMLPAAALLVPAYLTITDVPIVGVNLLNTPWALWLPAAANAFNIYVLKRFFDQIPDDLLDAANLDGAGRLRMLWSVVLPLSRPVLGVVSIFAVIGMWKDFLWPLLVLQDPETQTLSVALSRLSNTSQVPPTQMIAGLVIASVPMIVIFLIFQRSIIGGLSAGGMKG
ncbi:carbohydrate ABC transporter membrane protein 2, CUT1 family [Micromonospora pattaloongensis]|uniref:Carbohydrate ABC transporter membrane protein 2, CUT1 family n=1 Tax=Micromonospora pattaloongensis TaxID=405436 RepID=A0A1H3IC96_9ACTN|nr:carbohydrate ABC transporter permease [Micromonospora pattaloongensis]SDY25065.1 carbohydrate ABC transporter membrane protein 2, CUT1 family [Micromonospora pattaloongensis]